MAELKQLFDSFYSKFVLRDFLGKAIPGLILLSSLIEAFGITTAVVARLDDGGFATAFAAYGLAWIAGFTAQAIGELLPSWIGVRYFPEKEGNRRLNHSVLLKNRMRVANVTSDARHQVERLTVIKEATGNAQVALMLACVILIADGVLGALGAGASVFAWLRSEVYRIGAGVAFTVLAVGALGWMHRRHVEREWKLTTILLSQEGQKVDPADES